MCGGLNNIASASNRAVIRGKQFLDSSTNKNGALATMLTSRRFHVTPTLFKVFADRTTPSAANEKATSSSTSSPSPRLEASGWIPSPSSARLDAACSTSSFSTLSHDKAMPSFSGFIVAVKT
ncbi:uncharacterized protein LOC124551233 [Schistocerca americana]|uniref:uncharacterized protein LOC124551233 n=1 Tax=Schistocerca americana TaxID=7009 RepID=UPI001F4FEF7E|nr:uncharacterized protein LOC124551233 [Schistocerca americana]